MEIFIQGFTLGLAYLAPIGLQNIFVINSASTYAYSRSVINALVVAFFDITLAVACFYGVGEFMRLYEWLRMFVLLFGGALVIFIGIKLLRSKPAPLTARNKSLSTREIIVTSCVVTWFNPQAIIDGTMMLGAFNSVLNTQQHAPFMLGVCSASLVWFVGLTSAVNLCKRRLGHIFFRTVNFICGIIIVCYGCKLLFDFVKILRLNWKWQI